MGRNPDVQRASDLGDVVGLSFALWSDTGRVPGDTGGVLIVGELFPDREGATGFERRDSPNSR